MPAPQPETGASQDHSIGRRTHLCSCLDLHHCYRLPWYVNIQTAKQKRNVIDPLVCSIVMVEGDGLERDMPRMMLRPEQRIEADRPIFMDDRRDYREEWQIVAKRA